MPTSLSSSQVRAVMPTSAPACARASAMLRPMPRPAPVTMARLPSSGRGIRFAIKYVPSLALRIDDANIGAPGCQNGIDLVAGGQIATDDGWNTCLVAKLLAIRGQKTTPIGRFAFGGCLSDLYLDDITSVVLQYASDFDRLVGSQPTFDAIAGG